MPIYEYECQKCHKKHEFWQKITEEPMKKCPSCKGPLERLISGTSFALKGSGWYKTDYGGSGSSKEKESDGESKSDDSKSDDSKAPDAKSESKSDADEKKPNTYGANDKPEKKPEPKSEKSEKSGGSKASASSKKKRKR